MEFLKDIVANAGPVAEMIGYIAMVATIVVRMPFLKMDTSGVDGIVSWILKALAWLPTLGVNPRTKDLEDKVNEARGT